MMISDNDQDDNDNLTVANLCMTKLPFKVIMMMGNEDDCDDDDK